MARYAIGDVQGCYQSLIQLLNQIAFDQNNDELWFAGDLVNRGPDSLECLRFISHLGKNGGWPAKVVLGNHDLHLLATYYTQNTPKRKDTFDDILAAPDCDELMRWLRAQPLMIWDKSSDIAMVHAGIPHLWSTKKAYKLSQEVGKALNGPDHEYFFDNMYGNEPPSWTDKLSGSTRLRVITNYLTRMRFIKQNGELDFAAKETLDDAPNEYLPWFEIARPDTTRILFGHWAALQGETRLKGKTRAQYQALDTGCVWGGQLTAMNIDTLERYAVDGVLPKKHQK